MKKLCLVLFAFTNISYALPLNITPAYPLPTGIIPGNPVFAAYTVENNTHKQLNNLLVNPPNNVSINTTGCGATFNLASGSSCTLSLKITGTVNAQDSDVNNHLFVCLPGRKTCIGTNQPLNVQELKTPAYIYAGSTASSGLLSQCFIDPETGFVAGSLPINPSVTTTCPSTGTGVTFTSPQWIAFTASGQQVYITDADASTIWLCNVNTETAQFTNCQNSTASGFTAPAGIALNTAGTQAYVADATKNQVFLCNVNIYTGILSGCADSGAGAIFSEPGGIAITPDNATAFIANRSSTTISGCSINASTGQLSSCSTTGGFVEAFDLVIAPAGVAQGTLVYVTDNATLKIKVCTISGNTLNCSTVNSYTFNTGTNLYDNYSFNSPKGITLAISKAKNATSQIATVYVANSTLGSAGIAVCNYCQTNCPNSSSAGALICTNANISQINNIVGIALLD